MSDLHISQNGNPFIPNSFQTPNFVVDELMQYLTPSETCCLIYAIRQILGWKDKIVDRQARISISSFQHAGLGQTATRNALKGLSEYRILLPIGQPNMDGQMLYLQDDQDNIDWDGLKSRRAERDAKEIAQTARATEVRMDEGVTLNDTLTLNDRGGGNVER